MVYVLLSCHVMCLHTLQHNHLQLKGTAAAALQPAPAASQVTTPRTYPCVHIPHEMHVYTCHLHRIRRSPTVLLGDGACCGVSANACSVTLKHDVSNRLQRDVNTTKEASAARV